MPIPKTTPVPMVLREAAPEPAIGEVAHPPVGKPARRVFLVEQQRDVGMTIVCADALP